MTRIILFDSDKEPSHSVIAHSPLSKILGEGEGFIIQHFSDSGFYKTPLQGLRPHSVTSLFDASMKCGHSKEANVPPGSSGWFLQQNGSGFAAR